MKNEALLTFCIPAYNDAQTIEAVIKRCQEVAISLGFACAIYVVNDGSTDDTGKILTKLGHEIQALSVVTHARNMGYGETIRELYSLATTSWLFTLPGDYQIDPAEVVKLWKTKDDWDIMIGSRTDRQDGKRRQFQAYIYRICLRLLFGLTVGDVDSVKLIRTSAIQNIHITSTSAFVDAELIIRATRAGIRITEIPIAHKKRQEGQGGGSKLATVWPTIIDMITFRLRVG